MYPYSFSHLIQSIISKILYSTVSLIFMCLLLCCTENPFFNDSISGSNTRLISGMVNLENNQDPSGILVWLQQYNTYTFSDSAGNYSLKIPEKSENDPGGGITGSVKIFYYVSNYRLDSLTVYIFDGSFKPGVEDLGEDFNIKTKTLKNIVQISTSLELIENAFGQAEIFVTTNMVTPFEGTASVVSWLDEDGFLASFFIRPVDSLDNVFLYKNTIHLNTTIFRNSITFTGTIPLLSFPFENRVYEIFPYFFVDQDLPEGLLNAYNANVTSFSPEFLQLPIRQEIGSIVIL